MNNITVKNGIYQHYKKNYYEVVDMAYHSETLEQMVVYRRLSGDFSLWVRPAKMFIENVKINGSTIPRFKFISSESSAFFLKTLIL